MPLRREGGAAAEEDLAVLGIDITTSFFVSMVVVFVGHTTTYLPQQHTTFAYE
jgi:hypothetical protein